MKYFPLLYRLQAEQRYLIWKSDEQDSVAVDAEGFVPSFRDLISLRKYAELNHYRLESQVPVLHDLEWVATWEVAPTPQVDCEKTLAAWNLFRDVAGSIPNQRITLKLDSQLLWPICDKLFWGNNLPAMTPKGERYVPAWSPDELRYLAEVLTAGLDFFVSCIRSWPREP
jgi:hypothetical protein